MRQLIRALRHIPLFCELTTPELTEIAELMEHYSVRQDQVLLHQGDLLNQLLVLHTGSISTYQDSAEEEQVNFRPMEPGDHYGSEALLQDVVCEVSARALEPSEIYLLSRERFEHFLDENPEIADRLSIPETPEEPWDDLVLDWMSLDERVLFFATKSYWVLLGKLVVPLILALFFGVLALTLQRWEPLLGIMFLVIPVAVIRALDWRNDHYVITDKRVVHHESKLLSLRVTVDQAPLHQIQNVTSIRPSPTARALNIGTLIIETAGNRGAIEFRHIDDPPSCLHTLFEATDTAQSISHASRQTTIRSTIQQAFVPQKPHTEVDTDDESDSQHSEWDLENHKADNGDDESGSVLSAIGNAVNSILPRFRTESGGVVTWYKHPFVLINYTWKPAALLLIAGTVAIIWLALGNSLSVIWGLALAFLWLTSLFWFVWQYEDWRNDIFQMTDSHIIDIDRLPFGFRESKRQAALEQIQNINSVIPNVWARIFNYGNVIIETAGATGDLVFEWIMKPRAVQAEIFERMERTRAERQSLEAERRSQEMAQWFSVYDQMKDDNEL